VSVSISYLPSDVAGLDISRLIIARYDALRGLWMPLASSVDGANRRVSAQTDHLSLFQIMALHTATDVSSAKVFPNPWKESEASVMTFSLLPPGARIRIYTLTGVMVRDLSVDSSGIASWDGTNQGGTKVASGFYFAFVQAGGQKRTLKLVVER
jgi:hypothetical protein